MKITIEFYIFDLHIRISLGSKFHAQQTILIIWNNFRKQGKTEKMNITTEFLIFELFKESNFT